MLDAAGLSRSRFAISRLGELTNGLEVLAHPERAPFARRWVRRVRPQLDRSALGVLLGLIEHDSWYVPDFLVPHPRQYEPSLEDELDAVAATPPDVVLQQLALAFRIGTPPAVVLASAPGGGGPDPRPPLPPLIARVLHDGGESALVARVVDELRVCWKSVLADSWPLIRRVLDADVRHHATSGSRIGLASIVGDLHPGLVWNGGEVRLEHPRDRTVSGVSAVVLTPSVFLPRPAVWLSNLPEVVVGYPAYGRGEVWSVPAPLAGSSDLLGARRATLLADLGVPRSTSDLAARHRLSPATVSYHIGWLYRAGMLDRRRVGRAVLYQRNERASGLLKTLDRAEMGED